MHFINEILGLNSDKLTFYQMMARAAFVFFIALLFVCIAGIRTLGKHTVFDQLTILMLGAILGRAIVSEQPFFSSLAAAGVLMLLHRLIAWITFKSHGLGNFLKGKTYLLMKEGEKQNKNLNKLHITQDDIEEAMRLRTNKMDIQKVKEVYMERSGDISVIVDGLEEK